MLTKDNQLTFSGQSIYVGIDVHLKTWEVTILSEFCKVKAFRHPGGDSQGLIAHLKKKYPGADIHCVYEAGFSGFQLYYDLQQAGINCVVVHPPDVPTMDKEKRQKSDRIDSNKLAINLRAKCLRPIYVPSPAILAIRNFIRYRKRIVEQQTRAKNKIKHFLHFNGITIPVQLQGRKWTKSFLSWLVSLDQLTTWNRSTLDYMLATLAHYKSQLKEIDRKLVELAGQNPLKKNIDLLCGIPGVGLKTALVLATELSEINRFTSAEKLCSYIGLIPYISSSGDREYVGGLTIRGNRWVKSVLIESSWQLIKKDPAMLICFNNYCKRMPKNQAIIRIAKKLLKRIRHVLKEQNAYQLGVN